MEPMATVIILVTQARLVILVILVTPVQPVKWSRGLTLLILEPMKVDSQTIPFMTQMLEKIRQTRDCRITRALKLELLMGPTQRKGIIKTSQVLVMESQVNLMNT